MKTLLFVPLLIIGLVGCETRVSFSSTPTETTSSPAEEPPTVEGLSKVCINGVAYYKYGPPTQPDYTPVFDSTSLHVETCAQSK